VVQQLTNFLYGYTAEVLQDAAAIAVNQRKKSGSLRTTLPWMPPELVLSVVMGDGSA
jgi:hypothetical protein